MSEYEKITLPEKLICNLELLMCPICEESLEVCVREEKIRCVGCGKLFEEENGIPIMFYPNNWDSTKDVTPIVRSFYDRRPFPNYEEWDSAFTLREKAEKGSFARLLNDHIPHAANILEVGCGTGQLSNYLGLEWGRSVFGSDLSLGALKLGQEFKEKNNIDNVAFINMNLFRPAFNPATFDVVICNGVLHHTSDPYLGFQNIARLVKDNGYIIIGLYNRYGRLFTDIRRLIFKIFGTKFMFLDPHLRNSNLSAERKETWYADQYEHPHESKHTIGEVLKWFAKTDFQFVNGIPKTTFWGDFDQDKSLFEPDSKGTLLDHFLVQSGMLISGGSEGGFFLMIGQRSSK